AGPVTDELEKIFSRNYLILSAHGMLIASSAVCGILVSLIFISLKAYRQFEHIEEIKIYEDSTLRL
ncbi:MAG: hypothetical protein L6Q37_17365, partial [Bdellovibrionaceae bacterium]|nr:hypothetical protein [Pseudobdellovibrionaceae bacterium]